MCTTIACVFSKRVLFHRSTDLLRTSQVAVLNNLMSPFYSDSFIWSITSMGFETIMRDKIILHNQMDMWQSFIKR